MSGWLYREQDQKTAGMLRMKNRSSSEILSPTLRSSSEGQNTRLAKLEASFVLLEKSFSDNNKRISEWLMHFESALARINTGLEHMESEFSNSASKTDFDLKRLKKDLAESLDNALTTQVKELEVFKQALKQELEVFAGQIELKPGCEQQIQPAKPITNVTNANNINQVMPVAHYNVHAGLSNPEKWLMGVLFNAETPLSYSQISERTGKSISTARVYMNQLKIKGFVEESSLPNGVKIFSLKHDAKVKKLYNL